MRNRAKCKLCDSVIESFTMTDYVECKCGEIGIAGGADKLITSATDYANFLRIEDDGTAKPVQYQKEIVKDKPTKEQLLQELTQHLSNIEKLPPSGLNSYVTNYDLWSSLALISAILRS